MADNVLVVQIDLEKGEISPAFQEIEKRSNKSGKKSGSNFAAGFKQVLAGNLGADAIKSVLRGVTNELFNVVDAGKQLEVIETQFKTMLGSTKAAQRQLADLQQFAASTPFQLSGLADSTRQLLSFGVAQKDIIPTLGKLGDLAAGTGSSISDLAIPFGRLRASQKLTLQELDKFADRGINIFQEFANSTGMSVGEVRDAVSKGKIPFGEFEKAIDNLTGKGGKFFNGMAAQSRTLSGVLSTLKDNVFNLRANLGKTFSPIIITVIDKFTKAIQQLNKGTSEISLKEASDTFIAFNRAIIDYVITPLEYVINVGEVVARSLQAGFAAIIGAVGKLGGAFAKLLRFVGIKDQLAQSLEDFSESSGSVFEDFSKSAGDAIASITDTPITDKLTVVNEELAVSLDEMNATVAEKGAAIKTTLDETLTQPAKTAATTITGAWENLSFGLTKTANVVKEQSKKVATIIKNGLVKSISGGIQTLVTSLAQGQDAFKAMGKFILSTVGDLAIQLGQFFIAEGIAVEALNAVSGTGAIAAGAALIALGSLLKSFSGGGGSTGTTSSAGAGGTTGIGTPTEEVSFGEAGTDDEEFIEQTNRTLVINGDVFNNEETVRRLVDGFNENFEDTGASFTDARFA